MPEIFYQQIFYCNRERIESDTIAGATIFAQVAGKIWARCGPGDLGMSWGGGIKLLCKLLARSPARQAKTGQINLRRFLDGEITLKKNEDYKTISS